MKSDASNKPIKANNQPAHRHSKAHATPKKDDEQLLKLPKPNLGQTIRKGL